MQEKKIDIGLGICRVIEIDGKIEYFNTRDVLNLCEYKTRATISVDGEEKSDIRGFVKRETLIKFLNQKTKGRNGNYIERVEKKERLLEFLGESKNKVAIHSIKTRLGEVGVKSIDGVMYYRIIDICNLIGKNASSAFYREVETTQEGFADANLLFSYLKRMTEKAKTFETRHLSRILLKDIFGFESLADNNTNSVRKKQSKKSKCNCIFCKIIGFFTAPFGHKGE